MYKESEQQNSDRLPSIFFRLILLFSADACQPGMYSKDGIVPCSPCEVGYYQHMYGQSRCSLCPGSTSTLSVGYSAKSDCKGTIKENDI